jgi:glycerol kinase
MNSADCILAIDQGTTSSRALVFDRSARQLSLTQLPTTQLYPHPGWVNQNANEIWSSALQTARQALSIAGIEARQVAAIGIANQRETLIVWDRSTGHPVHPAIVWQSRQSQPQIDALVARGKSESIQRISGLLPDAYFTASKLAWLLAERPELRHQADAGDLLAGTVDSWLVWNLSGRHVHITDATNASRTMLFDIHNLAWSDDLLEELHIPSQMLPCVVASAGFLATTAPEIFGAEIPICGIAGDQQAALFGQTCFLPGEVKNTFGTGSFLLMNTGEVARTSANRLLTTVAWQLDTGVDYAFEGAVFASGAAVDGLRDGLGVIGAASDIEALAHSVPDAGGVTMVPAFAGLGAPYWNPSARGMILGITRGTTRAHLARATLEAMALQTRDVTDAMSADSGLPLQSLRVDGGAARNDLLLQIQADLLGVPVVRPKNIETTAVGAAFLAGLGRGIWPTRESLTDRWEIDRVFEPATSADERDARYADWRRAVDRSLDWAR